MLRTCSLVLTPAAYKYYSRLRHLVCSLLTSKKQPLIYVLALLAVGNSNSSIAPIILTKKPQSVPGCKPATSLENLLRCWLSGGWSNSVKGTIGFGLMANYD